MFPWFEYFYTPDVEIECLIRVSRLFVPNIIYSNSVSHFKSFEIEIKKWFYYICYLLVIVIQGRMFLGFFCFFKLFFHSVGAVWNIQ